MGLELLLHLKTDGIPVARRHGGAEFSDRSFSGQIQGEQSGNGGYRSVRTACQWENHVITDDNESIFIAERNAMHAMDGDRVRVLVYAKRRGHDAEGEVVEIVEKTPQIFVGTLEVQKHFAFLLTDNKVLANDIFIPKTALKGGKPEIRPSCVSPNGPIGPAIRMERSWIYWDLPEKTIPKYMPYWRNSDYRIVTPKQWKKRLIRFLTR